MTRKSILTPQQKNVLLLAATGKGNSQIAEALVVSKRTVDTHLRNAFAVLGVNDRASAVVLAIHYGEINLDIVVNTILADRVARKKNT